LKIELVGKEYLVNANGRQMFKVSNSVITIGMAIWQRKRKIFFSFIIIIIIIILCFLFS